MPINIHCNFEKGMSNTAKKKIFFFPNISIKYCIWHYQRSLEKQKQNKLCYNERNNNNNIFIIKSFQTCLL